MCGCVAVPVNWFFDIVSSFFAKFKNVVHSLEPCETPSYSASHQAPNYVQCLNITKYFKTLRCGCVYFFNLIKTSTVNNDMHGHHILIWFLCSFCVILINDVLQLLNNYCITLVEGGLIRILRCTSTAITTGKNTKWNNIY